MIPVISHLTAAGYKHVAKPLLFRQPPDDVHDHMVATGKFVQRLTPIRSTLHWAWAYRNPRLSQTVFGLQFANPIGLSAGLDKNFELAPLMRSVGFGFMEGGSITFEPCAGNPKPWFHRLPADGSLVVNAGLANQGAERIVARLQAQTVLPNFPLNISVAKTNSAQACSTNAAIADYLGSLKLIQKSGVAQLVTLNISCPNTFGGQPFTTPERLEALLSATDTLNLTVPLIVKMPNHLEWPEFCQLAEVAADHQVAGLTISNLAYRDQVKLSQPIPITIPGKLSGRPTLARSNQLIGHTKRHFGDRFVIIGVGGVFSAEDAYTKITLGANLVELITGLIFQGPQLIGQINADLIKLLDRDGYDHISDAVGSNPLMLN